MRAVNVRLLPPDLELLGYDSSVDGFGLILDDFDLGTLHSALSGVLLDITITNVGGAGVVEGFGSWALRNDRASITYTFSQPVSFYFTRGSGTDPFEMTVQNSFGPGETEIFSGSPASFLLLTPVPLNPAMTISANSIANLTENLEFQSYAYGFASGTSLTWTHDDVIGGFSDSDLNAWVVNVPEPSRAMLSLLAFAAVLVRRRR